MEIARAIALAAALIELRRGWRRVGRRMPALVEVLDEGWLPRPGALRSDAR